MSFEFNEFNYAMATQTVDLSSDDIRAVLVMANTTFTTDYDIATMGATAVPDYCNGINHDSVNGHALSTLSVTRVTGVSGYAKFTAANLTFSSLGAGTRNNVALVIFKWITDIDSSLPIAYIDSGGFPFNGNGGDVTMSWNAAGILKVGAPA